MFFNKSFLLSEKLVIPIRIDYVLLSITIQNNHPKVVCKCVFSACASSSGAPVGTEATPLVPPSTVAKERVVVTVAVDVVSGWHVMALTLVYIYNTPAYV